MEGFSDFTDRQVSSFPKREALACVVSFQNLLLQAQFQAEMKQVSWELYPG
jgi:hypothetical protein